MNLSHTLQELEKTFPEAVLTLGDYLASQLTLYSLAKSFQHALHNFHFHTTSVRKKH